MLQPNLLVVRVEDYLVRPRHGPDPNAADADRMAKARLHGTLQHDGGSRWSVLLGRMVRLHQMRLEAGRLRHELRRASDDLLEHVDPDREVRGREQRSLVLANPRLDRWRFGLPARGADDDRAAGGQHVLDV